MNLRGARLRDFCVAAAFAALFLAGLGRPELLDPDESRHAGIASEMLAARSFVVPRIGGEPYYDKPVGFHWLAAASLAVLGPGTAAARLPSALAALATLAVTAWWGGRLYGPAAGRFAAAMLGTTYFFLALGRFAGIDMLFTALLTSGAAWLSVEAGSHTAPAGAPGRRRSVLPAYALFAAATLVKGPAALVLSAPPLAAAFFAWGPDRRARLEPWRGSLLAAAIVLPWYAAAAAADPAYIRTFLETHNLQRFVGDPTLPHQRPLTYYAAALPLALMPWTPALMWGLVARLRRGEVTASERVALLWLAGVILFFALARTRLVTYLLPAFPVWTMIAAGELARAPGTEGDRRRRLWVLWVQSCGTGIVLACLGASALAVVSGPDSCWGLGVGAGAAALAALAYAAALWRVGRRSGRGALQPACVLATGTFVAAIAAYGPVATMLTRAKGYRSLGTTVARSLPPDGRVASLSRAAHALSFYSQRRVSRLQDLDAARAALAGDGPQLVLTKNSYADELLHESGGHCEILWRNAQGTTLVANGAAAAAWRRREGVEPSADL